MFYFNFYLLFIWLHQVLVAAHGKLYLQLANSYLQHVESTSLTREQTWAPALGAWNLSHWTTREVPAYLFISVWMVPICCILWVIILLLLLLSLTSIVSNSVQPHRRQPTRLPCPWDSPGKNIRVGCHFLLQCIKVKSESEVTQWCQTFSDPMDCSLPGSSIHGIFQARVLE